MEQRPGYHFEYHSVEIIDGQAVVKIGRDLDVYTAPECRAIITDLNQRHIKNPEDHLNAIVIDLEQVNILDSTGLGVIVGGHKRSLSNEIPYRLRNAKSNPRIFKVLEITGLAKVIDLEEDLQP